MSTHNICLNGEKKNTNIIWLKKSATSGAMSMVGVLVVYIYFKHFLFHDTQYVIFDVQIMCVIFDVGKEPLSHN